MAAPLTLLCCCAEWHFRSSLDRYVWIHGMICAYMKPWAEGILVRIDNMAFRARIATRSLLLAGTLPSFIFSPCPFASSSVDAVQASKDLCCLCGSCCRPAEATSVMRVSGILCSAPT